MKKLDIGDIIWSKYGDNGGISRDVKPFTITEITEKGYIAADCSDMDKSYKLTLKSEHTAWARTREEAHKNVKDTKEETSMLDITKIQDDKKINAEYKKINNIRLEFLENKPKRL